MVFARHDGGSFVKAASTNRSVMNADCLIHLHFFQLNFFELCVEDIRFQNNTYSFYYIILAEH